jgi:hypothetical protein
MTNPARQSYSSMTTGSGALMAAAGLLILLGIVFQLAEFGYGQLVPGEGWLLSMVASDLWNAIALHLNMPALQQLLEYWPLLLVCAGSGLLAALRGGSARLPARDSGN